jgi:hypothetical protein
MTVEAVADKTAENIWNSVQRFLTKLACGQERGNINKIL